MRAPNIAIFVVTVVLAFVSVWEYSGAPLSIPDIAIPLVGITTTQIPPFLATNAFWLMFLAWVLLAIASLVPRGAAEKPDAGHRVANLKPAA